MSNHDNVNFNHEQIWGASRTANRARKDQAKPTVYMFNHYWEMRLRETVPCTVTENREKMGAGCPNGARPPDSYNRRWGGLTDVFLSRKYSARPAPATCTPSSVSRSTRIGAPAHSAPQGFRGLAKLHLDSSIGIAQRLPTRGPPSTQNTTTGTRGSRRQYQRLGVS